MSRDCIIYYFYAMLTNTRTHATTHILTHTLSLPFSLFSNIGIISYLSFGAGVGPIHMDNVYCSGFEEFLVNCSYSAPYWDSHNEDAGVRCSPRELQCMFLN